MNALFQKKGWIQSKHRNLPAELSQGSGQGGIPELVSNWDVIAHPSGAQAAVYTRSASLTTQALAALKPIAPGHFRVLSRKELDELHAFPGAAFALDPVKGFAMSGDLEGPLFQTLKKPHGEHGQLPTTPGLQSGFIAVGACARAGKNLGPISILDVAPTAARFLGISLPNAQGKALDLTSP